MLTLSSKLLSEPAHTHQSKPTVRLTLQRLVGILRGAEPWGQAVVLMTLRLIYGWFFMQAGWGKFTNLDRTSAFFASLGLPAPYFMATLVATTELAGGIFLFLGVGTRLVSAILITVLLTAFVTAHASDAFQNLASFTEQAPYPFLVATLILLVFGAGRLSLDSWRSKNRAMGG